jgi:hypothetical protein
MPRARRLKKWESPMVSAVLRVPDLPSPPRPRIPHLPLPPLPPWPGPGPGPGPDPAANAVAIVAVVAVAARVAAGSTQFIANMSKDEKTSIAHTAKLIRNDPNLVKRALGPGFARTPELQRTAMDRIIRVLR